jgi:hypothetical protein
MLLIKAWDDQQVARLEELIASGASPFRAAAALGRSETSVKVKARKLGTPFPTRREARRRLQERFAAAEAGDQSKAPPNGM